MYKRQVLAAAREAAAGTLGSISGFPSVAPKARIWQVCILFAWGGQHAGVGRVGLGAPVGFFPLFTLEFSQQKKKISAEITMSTLPKWVI